MSTRPQLGPFVVSDSIAQGGMGAVYLGRHVETGHEVALKVWLAASARSSQRRQAFRQEARALAKLYHPSVAAILDYGELDDPTAAVGPETWRAGAPWFAMEYVDGRSLEEVDVDWTWEALESFLLTVLDALAHAHARSVIHRDLKPSNVMIAGEIDDIDRRRVKVVDFGIAQVPDPDSEHALERSRRVVGTPKYMAPEQIRGNPRDQGPWTDLYALGCLTWRLVCGEAPFAEAETEEVLRGHIESGLPAYEPRFAVPVGFEGWLRQLLRKSIEERTRRAADAAWSLLALDRAEQVDPVRETEKNRTITPRIEVGSTLGGLADTLEEEGSPTFGEVEEEPELGSTGSRPKLNRASRSGGSRDDAPPPIPPDWRRDQGGRTAAILPKSGLELFGLREVPVVDRESERDRLWSALRTVEQEGAPLLVTLEGGPGTGKSRLAEWLGRRADEIGAARTLRGTHTAASQPDEGLRDVVRRTYQTAGLSRREVFERLVERLPSLPREDGPMRLTDARALTELLRPTPRDVEPEEGPRYHFSEPGQKYALVRRFLRRMATHRRLVVWFDDLQWGRETIGALEELFSDVGAAPEILVVATLRSDVVAADRRLAERLEELFAAAETDRLELEPLDGRDHRRLVERMLDLDPELVDELVDRTEGRPLFAVQLLRSWVDRGLLEPGESGFRLADGTEVGIPDDIHRLWIDRLGRLVASVPTADAEAVWWALERAAAMGREVDAREWAAICESVGGVPDDVIRSLAISSGLAHASERGWAFEHHLLVESLERHAREENRWRDHHAACAELLADLFPEASEETAARRADHWIAAGRSARALEPLRREARRLSRRAEHDAEHEVLEERERIFDELDVPSEDRRRLENRVRMIRNALQRGVDPERLLDAVEELVDTATDIGFADAAARALSLGSVLYRRIGEAERGLEFGRRSVEFAATTGDGATESFCRVKSGFAAFESGAFEEAIDEFRTGAESAIEEDLSYRYVQAQHGLGCVRLMQGETERAEEAFQEMLEISREEGTSGAESKALNGLGELARYGGEIDRAREYYRDYRRVERELNNPFRVAIADLNLAQVEIRAGNFERAREYLEQGRGRLRASNNEGGRTHLLRVIELAVAAGTGDWSTFDEILVHYEAGWPEEARHIRDHPWVLEIAGEHAADAGADERAARTWRLGASLWRRLGDEDSAVDLEQRAERIE